MVAYLSDIKRFNIVRSLRDQEVACSALDRQGSNFESCVWRAVSSHSSHHPQEFLLTQFSLYVHKSGLKPDLFLFISDIKHWRYFFSTDFVWDVFVIYLNHVSGVFLCLQGVLLRRRSTVVSHQDHDVVPQHSLLCKYNNSSQKHELLI